MSDNSPNTEKPDPDDTSEVSEPSDDDMIYRWNFIAAGVTVIGLISMLVLSFIDEYHYRSEQSIFTNMVTVKGGLGNVDAFNDVYAVSIDRNGNIHAIGVDAGPSKGSSSDASGPRQDGNYSVSIHRNKRKGNWLHADPHEADLIYSVTVNTSGGSMSPHCTILDSTGKVLTNESSTVTEKSASGNDTSVTCKYTEHVSW